MELAPMKVGTREQTGKGPARRMRVEGLIPGVVYGLGRDTVSLSIPQRSFERLYVGSEGANVLIDLEVPGEEREESVAAIIKEVQRDPVTRALLSVDLQWVSLRETIQVEVPLEVTGDAPGVKDDGGVVQQQLHAVTVSCLPTAIPEHIAANIDGMHISDALFVGDLPEIEGVAYVPEADEVVLTIARPIREEDLETRIDEELLESLVDLEVGEEAAEAEELAPEEGEQAPPTEGTQVDVQEIDESELTEGPA